MGGDKNKAVYRPKGLEGKARSKKQWKKSEILSRKRRICCPGFPGNLGVDEDG